VWSVKSAGGTGAAINGNTLTTTAAGTVTVTAAIVNGQTASSDYTQDFNITVLSPQMPADSLEAALNWIKDNAAAGGEYTVTLTADETITPATLSYNGKTVSITLVGSASERTVSLSANGSLFTVGSKVTLTLGNNVTLQGKSGNNAALVRVNSGGALKMNTGSKITGNAGGGDGGGVYVSGGTFTMSGGTISGNEVRSDSSSYGGGGVCVVGGTFTMSGGTISGNKGLYGMSYIYTRDAGGGVYVSRGGTFTMSGNAQISGNTGSGVYVVGGAFTMSGNAQIRGNDGSDGNSGSDNGLAAAGGGGVHITGERVNNSYVIGTFTMEGGTISGNKAYDAAVGEGGGGVYVGNHGTFTMKDGEISGNEAWFRGGGVSVRGTFTMEDGEISGNMAPDGGGVYVYDDGAFTKSDGTIYGDMDTTYTAGSTENTATSGNGHAVYVSSSPAKKRNTMAGPDAGLDSGTAANWE
jgi:hypothetical protein